MRTFSAESRVLGTVLLLAAASSGIYLHGDSLVRAATVTAMGAILVATTAARVATTDGFARLMYVLLGVAYAWETAASALWLATFARGEPEASTHLAVHSLMAGGYLFLLAAALLMIGRSARHGTGGALDATMLTLAATSAMWQAFLSPALDLAGAAGWQRWHILIVVATLTGSIGVMVGLRSTGGAPRTARPIKCYFVVALATAVVGNALETVLADPVTRVAPGWIGVLWPVAFAATWGAIAHPAGPDAFRIVPQRPIRLTTRRLLVLGVAMMTTPAILIARVASGDTVDVASGAGASWVITLLVLTRIGQLAASHRESEDRLQFLADHDALTGLPNRRAVHRHLADLAVRVREGRSRGVVVWFIDLDDFKAINDGRGHAAGDELLVAVSERLGTLVRHDARDLVGRLGGDEFIVVVEGDPAVVTSPVQERITALFDDFFVLTDGPARATASVGVATARPGDHPTVDSLLTGADSAMYRHKHDGTRRPTP